MKYYLVVFDRNPTKQYADFHTDFVEPFTYWWHYIKSCYIVGTDWTADQVTNHFRDSAKKHDIPNTHLLFPVNLSTR